MDEAREDASLEAELTAWGKAITLETRGRRSGLPRRVTVGYVQEGETLLIAAASDATHWARNLQAHPACEARLRDERRAYRAEALSSGERDAAIAALIIKYGTPAERLGGGPAFRLRPT